MTVLQNSSIIAGASGNQGDYNIARSLRFRSSASAYLSRTPASAGNRKTWTYSTWVKLGALTSANNLPILLSAGVPGSNNRCEIRFNANSINWLFEYTSPTIDAFISFPNKFRDPSSWYHFVFVADTTNATSTDRLKIFVNGVRLTNPDGGAVYPSLNLDGFVNATQQHYFGNPILSGYDYFDGYVAEQNFIDGQALTPSSFGSTNSQTGVWQPKKYAGTYGTNGFYLPFTDVATTSGSNAGLGKDFSGNGNYWNTNNISVTAGATYDSMKDVPTLTDADTANYCVMNPLRPSSYGAATLSDGNLKVSQSTGAYVASTSTMPMSSGKWYWEVNCGTAGFVTSIGITTNIAANGFTTGTATYHYDGTKYLGASNSAYGSSYTGGDTLGFALDMDAGTLVCYKNNVSQGTLATGLTGDCYAYATLYGTNNVSYNFGQRPFSYSPPTGFKALNTYNLPTPTIGATASTLASKNFNSVLYTGTGADLAVTGVGFQPDMIWTKARSAVDNHVIVDAVRGVGNIILTNSTNAESVYGAFDSFDADGFTKNSLESVSGRTYVAWQWKANGSAVSNTAGTITSTVSANPTAGFSVITYTGNGTAGATIGHGLGVAPKMVIVKSRGIVSPNYGWQVQHASLGATKFIVLNSTGASVTSSGMWNDTAPTSSVFSLGNDWDVNKSATTYVAYCFAEVAGYSKFGSYTGNGSADGTFVATGFKPKFIMVKCTNDISHWTIVDRASNPYNVAVNSLYADTSASENATIMDVDFLSNGFKLRGVLANECNVSGYTYVYMAFAEVPQKFALGT